MPDDRLYDDADVAAVVDAIYAPLPGDPSPGPELNRTGSRLHTKARSVLETLTAPGSPLLARHRAQVAEQIAQTIEARLSEDPDAESPYGAGMNEAAMIAREVGGTTAEEAT